jgi:hypothetical protein
MPDRWAANDWRLGLKQGAEPASITTEAEFGDCEIILDAKLSAKAENGPVKFSFRGGEFTLPLSDKWQRFTVEAKNGRLTSSLEGFVDLVNAPLPRQKGAITLTGSGAPVEFASIYVRDL